MFRGQEVIFTAWATTRRGYVTEQETRFGLWGVIFYPGCDKCADCKGFSALIPERDLIPVVVMVKENPGAWDGTATDKAPF